MTASVKSPGVRQAPILQQIGALLAVSSWVLVGFFGASLIVNEFANLLSANGVDFNQQKNLWFLALGVLLYALMGAIVLSSLLVTQGGRLSMRGILGLERLLPKWIDVGLALMGVVLSFVVGAIVLLLVARLYPDLNLAQEQELGVVSPTGYELGLVVLLFVVIGPVIEELIFRGYMYGFLRKLGVNVWLVTIAVSLLFGLVHLQWNVGISVFVLSLAMCVAREVTGSLWAPILMHMLKNGIAAYLLFFVGLG